MGDAMRCQGTVADIQDAFHTQLRVFESKIVAGKVMCVV
jgi:hypothetical protein